MRHKYWWIVFILMAGCTAKSSPGRPLPVDIAELNTLSVTGDGGQNSLEFTSPAGPTYSVIVHHRMTAERATSFIQQQRYLIESLFREEKSPYPGMVSSVVHCPEAFRPQFQENHTGDEDRLRVQLYANSRRAFGVCNDEARAYRSVMLIVFCRNSGELVQIKGFADFKKSTDWTNWLVPKSCRKLP